jgi:hypothetical protein
VLGQLAMAVELYAMFDGLDQAAWAAAWSITGPAAMGGAARACGHAAVVGLPSAQSLVVPPARRGVCGWRIAGEMSDVDRGGTG